MLPEEMVPNTERQALYFIKRKNREALFSKYRYTQAQQKRLEAPSASLGRNLQASLLAFLPVYLGFSPGSPFNSPDSDASCKRAGFVALHPVGAGRASPARWSPPRPSPPSAALAFDPQVSSPTGTSWGAPSRPEGRGGITVGREPTGWPGRQWSAPTGQCPGSVPTRLPLCPQQPNLGDLWSPP